MTSKEVDWTADPTSGASNSSQEFLQLEQEIGRLIRNSAHDIVCGKTDAVGRLILAQLAHVHGLAPTRTSDRKIRADERREKVKDLRMSTEEHVSIDPPPKMAPMPVVSGTCTYCGNVIGDEDADWRADPESAAFVKIHTSCFRKRAASPAPEAPEDHV